jgi:hypothetical protein
VLHRFASDFARRPRLALITAAALAAIALAGASPSGAAASGDGDYYAISAPELLRMSSAGEAERLERHLVQVEAAGIEAVRVNVSWADYESFAKQGLHPWRDLDTFVTALANHDLRMLPVPRGAPWWARAADAATCPDRDRSAILPSAFGDYAAFVGAIAARYGPDGAFWRWFDQLPERPITQLELWNEPNWTGFWCPAPDPEAFAKLVSGGAVAVRTANPAVDVVLGGLVSITEDAHYYNGHTRGIAADDFLARMLAAVPALADQLDSVGVHLYEPQPSADLDRLAWMREAIDAAGLERAEIAITEFGWNRLQLSDQAIAANYSTFVGELARNRDCGVSTIAAHSWATDEANAYDSEDWWGLADPVTGEPYAGGAAYGAQIARAAGPSAAGWVSICAGEPTPPATTTTPKPPTTSEATPPSNPSPTQPAVAELRLPGGAKTDDRSPTFRFVVEAGSGAQCRIDRGAWRGCRSPHTVKRLAGGRHVLSVQALDASGRGAGKVARLAFRIVG